MYWLLFGGQSNPHEKGDWIRVIGIRSPFCALRFAWLLYFGSECCWGYGFRKWNSKTISTPSYGLCISRLITGILLRNISCGHLLLNYYATVSLLGCAFCPLSNKLLNLAESPQSLPYRSKVTSVEGAASM